MPEQASPGTPATGKDLPWYRQFWPWFIIALPATAVAGGLLTLWIAMSNPDHLVIDDDEYSRLRSSLKAQTEEPTTIETGSNND